MAVTNASLLPSVVGPYLNKVFDGKFNENPPEWSEVFDKIKGIERSVHEEPVLGGLTAAQLKPAGSPAVEDTIAEAYRKPYVYDVYAISGSLTQEVIEDGEYLGMTGLIAEQGARSIRSTQEIVAANILNLGFTAVASGGTTVGDGVPLFSASHPNQSGLNGSNIGTASANLSEAALEDLLIQAAKFKDQKGNFMLLKTQKLVVPPDLEYVASRLVSSTLRPGTNNNDINAAKYLGKLPDGFTRMTRLTNPNAYFLKTDCPQGAQYIERRAPTKKTDYDALADIIRFVMTHRYQFGVTNWGALYGNPGL